MKMNNQNRKNQEFLPKAHLAIVHKILCTILLILPLLALSLFSCNTDIQNPQADGSTANGDTAAADSRPSIVAGGVTDYKIIYPAGSDSYVSMYANSLRTAIKDATGVNIRIIPDGTPKEEGTREILVGYTNREQSRKVYEGLRQNDWRIEADADGIAIAAYNDQTLKFAVNRFVQKTQTVENTLYYEVFKEEKLRTYDVNNLTLDGTDISQYTIICSNDTDEEYAKSICELIAEYNGNVLQIDTEVQTGKKPFYIGSSVYPGEADKKETTSYILSKTEDGAALWCYDGKARLDAYTALEGKFKTVSMDAELCEMLTSKIRYNEEEIMNLKIMSFNVRNGWSNAGADAVGPRDDLVATKILSQLPDVIGFQEFDAQYRNAQNPLPTLISAKYAEAKVVETDATLDMSWNPIFYNKERLSVIVCGSVAFTNGTEYTYPLGGNSKFRTISWAVFEDIETKQRFLFVNTHYDYTPDNTSTTASNQRAEVSQLSQLVTQKLTEYGLSTVFVTGDYNASSNWSAGAYCLMRNGGWLDTRTIAAQKDNLPSSTAGVGSSVDTSKDYTQAIDHVMYKTQDEITVSKYQTVTDMPDASDHCAIFVDLTIKKLY